MADYNIDLGIPPVHAQPNPVPMATAVPVGTDDGILFSTSLPSSSHCGSSTASPYARASFSSGITSKNKAHTAPGELISANDNPHLREDQIEQLRDQGFPSGLAIELGRSRAIYPLRFWVVDNSGSMQTSDGHELRGSSSNIQVVSCTRWTELRSSLEYHIELAGLLEATTIFRLLNDPGSTVGPAQFTVGAAGDATSIPQQVQNAVQVMRMAAPRGVTPLTRHLDEIRFHLLEMEQSLRERGQEAVVVLATDGLPSNSYGESSPEVLEEFVVALKALQALPVWIVVRLCTDDQRVVTYYNNLDAQLELPLEVIDDFFNEAVELGKANKWLNYALPLHRCRERGYHDRIFDLLDECLLNKDQLVEFVRLLFAPSYPLPDPHTDWKEFVKQVENLVAVEPKQFNPRTRKLEPWIDVKKMDRLYGGGFMSRIFGKKK